MPPSSYSNTNLQDQPKSPEILQLITLSGNTIQIELNAKVISCLIDTGAAISCVSKTFLQSFGYQKSDLKHSNIRDAMGVGGEVHAILGTIDLEFQMAKIHFKHKFYVFEKLQQNMILGIDFLKPNKIKINFDDDTINVPDTCKNQDNNQDKSDLNKTIFTLEMNTGLATTINNISIQPFQEALIPIHVSNIKNTTAIIEPLPNLPDKSLAGAKCCVTLQNDNQSIMLIMNPTNKTIDLPANYVVASVSSLPSQSIFQMTQNQATHDAQQHNAKNNTKSENNDHLEFDLEKSDLTNHQKEILVDFLNKNRKVFAKDLSELGHTHLYSHTIDTGDAAPIRRRFYRQSPHVAEEMNRQLEEMLKNDIIEESNSDWFSPVVMCKKRSGELRFCVDYRGLNKVTKPKFFPLPRLEDVFDALGKAEATIFSTLDLMSGYWQVGLDRATAHKAAFVTPSGVYQWKRLPFGLASAPASFQQLLTQVLKQLNYKMALVYVDDILVFSKSFEDHLKHLQLVFDRLRSAGLTLKPSKCLFARPEVTYLGHVISKKGVHADISKVQAVQSFPVPKNQQQLRSFLGLCNYYKKFVKGYSHIVSPLNKLLRKDFPFEWSVKCQEAFDQLKSSLCSSPILIYPNLSKPFILTTDASGTAIGYILGQLDANGNEAVIAYNGRSLTPAERKWPIGELECLAVLEGIKTFHVYLANSRFKIYTDHQALTWLSKVKQSTGRLARWSVLLQGYNYEICYRKGKNNTNADCLSRRDYETTDENTMEPEDSLPSINTVKQPNEPTIEVNFIYSETDSSSPSVLEITAETKSEVIPENIGELQRECPDFKFIYQYLEDQSLPEEEGQSQKVIQQSQQYELLDGVLYHMFQPRTRGKKHDRIIKQLACPRQFRDNLLCAYHELGHFGFDRTYISLKQKYYFPGMYQAVADYIRACEPCQRAKQPAHSKKVPLTPMPVNDTFSRWHLDFIGPFKKVTKEGYTHILIIVDSFSKWTEAFPVRSESAEQIANILHNEIFSRYGAPKSLISDRGQGFMSKLVAAINQIYEVKHHFTSSYHPQTNSVAERTNKTIIQCLRTVIDKNQLNWPELLPGILMAFRMTPSATSEFSPYYLVFGKEMNVPIDNTLVPKTDIPKNLRKHVENILHNLKIAKTIATENIKHAQQKQKAHYDKKTALPTFEINDQVLLFTPKVPVGLSSKLHKKQQGPFYIAAKGPNHTYKLRRCDDNKELKSFINANRLKIYTPPDHRPSLNPPPPNIPRDDPQIEIRPNFENPPNLEQNNADPQANPESNNSQFDDNSKQYYEVEKLLKSRRLNGQLQFLIKWQGFKEKTWEPDHHLPTQMVRQFLSTKTQKGTRLKRKRKTLFQ